jgi:methyl-accepting chemotaxis protein
MRNPLKLLFLRTTLKVELIIYCIPVPVLVYFFLFAFHYARRDPLPFMIAVTAASSLAIVSGLAIRWLPLRHMKALSRSGAMGKAGLVRRAVRAAHALPLSESLSVFLRWLFAPGLLVTLPFTLTGRMSVMEAVSTTLFTGFTGLVSIPLVYYICETETSVFLEFLRRQGITEEFRNPVRIGITARLVATLLLVISYPTGLFLQLIFLSNAGYLDLRTVPAGFGLLVSCTAVLSVTVAVLFSRSVGLALRGINRSLEGVSHGDLTQELAVRDGDEMGDLARHYTTVIAALGGSVQSVRDSAERLSQWVKDISAASGALAEASAGQQANAQSVLATMEQFSASLQSVTGRVTAHAQTVAESASAVEELSAGVASIARGAGSVRDTVGENVATIGRGREKIQASIDETMRMNESMGRVSATIREIGGRFQQIEETLSILSNLSGQTNVLAMNAAIEAAHAGDAGRGFGIVAAEVRRLAERSGEFVKEIGNVIKNIGGQVEEAVRIVESGESIFRAGRSAAEEAEQALEGIVKSSERIDALVEEISRTTGEQAQAAANALSGIDALREFSHSVSAEVESQAASARQIMESIKAIGDGTQKNSRASSGLSELASALRSKSEELTMTVSRFKLRNGSPSGNGA